MKYHEHTAPLGRCRKRFPGAPGPFETPGTAQGDMALGAKHGWVMLGE